MRVRSKHLKGQKPNDHRNTPEEVWRPLTTALHAVTGQGRFDLDPCSNEHSTIPANSTYDITQGQDGLLLPWLGHVFVNPPFSQFNAWVDAVERNTYTDAVESIAFLGLDDMTTKWAQRMSGIASASMTYRKRHHFPLPGNPEGQPMGGMRVWLVCAQGFDAWEWSTSLRKQGCMTWYEDND